MGLQRQLHKKAPLSSHNALERLAYRERDRFELSRIIRTYPKTLTARWEKKKKKKGQKESWEKNKAKPRRELLALGLPLPSSTHISVLIGGH